MRCVLALLLCSAAAFAAKTDHPTGSRITPPSITAVAPLGLARGTTTELTIEGLNLANATAIYFSEPGLKGRILRVKELPDLTENRLGSNGTRSTIDLGPLPPRNQVTVEVDIAPDANVGVAKFRLLTPLGTSPEGRVLVEPYFGEAADSEPNNSPETAFDTYLPSILAGTIARPGDVDYFKIQVKDGEELVFENPAMALGSTLSPVVAIVTADNTLIKEYGYQDTAQAAAFSHRFEKGGTYYVRLSDYQRSGRASHFYRYKLGRFALATSAYPLGLRKGGATQVQLSGYQLRETNLTVKGESSPGLEGALTLRPGKSFSELRLAVGEEPETEASGTNTTLGAAQPVTLPVTINGRIAQPQAVHYYRFAAKKGQRIVLEVEAR
ncbi:MAG: hypothetical protein SFV51_23790, partial [Bryobacteraceae bacterium]|nr:hypothetical protein [Bryobacteraceae bacterium]